MSGGFVKSQKSGDHQVIMFTVVGNLTSAQASEWNRCIRELKQSLAGRLIGVTMTGHKSPRASKKRVAKKRGRRR